MSHPKTCTWDLILTFILIPVVTSGVFPSDYSVDKGYANTSRINQCQPPLPPYSEVPTANTPNSG